jgi:hypothetical protein
VEVYQRLVAAVNGLVNRPRVRFIAVFADPIVLVASSMLLWRVTRREAATRLQTQVWPWPGVLADVHRKGRSAGSQAALFLPHG